MYNYNDIFVKLERWISETIQAFEPDLKGVPSISHYKLGKRGYIDKGQDGKRKVGYMANLQNMAEFCKELVPAPLFTLVFQRSGEKISFPVFKKLREMRLEATGNDAVFIAPAIKIKQPEAVEAANKGAIIKPVAKTTKTSNQWWAEMFDKATENLNGAPYAVRKGFASRRMAAVRKMQDGSILAQITTPTLPVYQLITEGGSEGRKKLFVGCGKEERGESRISPNGGYIPIIHATSESKTILVAEGIATAVSVSEAMPGIPTYVGLNADNLKNVTILLKKKFPQADIVVCGDNDREDAKKKNSVAAACKSALVVGGRVALPNAPHKDFNDWQTAEGKTYRTDAANVIRNAKLPLAGLSKKKRDAVDAAIRTFGEQNVDVMLVSDRYLTESTYNRFKDYRAVFLSSGLGTGKTQAIAKAVANDSVLAVSHLVSLTEQLAERIGLESYQEFKKNMRSCTNKNKGVAIIPNRLAMCLNSLYTLQTSRKVEMESPFKWLILDESEQSVRRLVSSIDQKEACINMFQCYSQMAKTVVCADAHLGSLSVDAVSNAIGKGGKVLFVINSNQACRDWTINIHTRKGSVLKTSADLLKKGQKAYIAYNSITEAQNMYAYCQLQNYKVLYVSGDNTGDEDVKAFCARPNEEIGKYQCVIATPAITSGISIDTEGYHVFGCFGNRPTTACDMIQSLRRVRNPISISLFVRDVEGNLETNEAILRYEIEKTTEIDKRMFTYHVSENVLKRIAKVNGYLELKAKVKSEENDMLNAPRKNLEALLKEEGFAIRTVHVSKEAEKENREFCKLLQNAGETYFNGRVERAKHVEDEEAEEIKRKARRTMAETDQLMKHVMLKFGILPKPENEQDHQHVAKLVVADKRGKMRRAVIARERIAMSESALATLHAKELREKDVLEFDREHVFIRRFITKAFADGLGLTDGLVNGTFAGKTLAKEEIASLVAWQKECCTTIANACNTYIKLADIEADLVKDPMCLARKVARLLGLKLRKDKETGEYSLSERYEFTNYLIARRKNLKRTTHIEPNT